MKQEYLKAKNLLSLRDSEANVASLVQLLNDVFEQVRQGAVTLTIKDNKWTTSPTEDQNLAAVVIAPSYAVTGAPPSYYLEVTKGQDVAQFCIQAPDHMEGEIAAWYIELWKTVHNRPRLRDVQAVGFDKAFAFIKSLL